MLSFLRNIGTTELIIILAVILLFFGGKKFMELSRGMGESAKELKKIKRDITGEKKTKKKEEEPEEEVS
jgi:sec-independent protein translocase protein TatA